MQEEKTGFIEQFLIACFQPSRYGKLVKNRKSTITIYTVVLLIFLVFIENGIPFAAWNVSVGGMRNMILNGIPAFYLENGEMHCDKKLDFLINGVVHIRLDASEDEFTGADLSSTYTQEVLISRTNILLRSSGQVGTIKLSDLSTTRFDNQSLADSLPGIRILIVIYFLVSFFIKAIEYLFMALVYAVICRNSVKTPVGDTVSYSECFVIALYAKTLFGIIYSVNAALDMPISGMLLVMLSVLVTMGIVNRAQAAILGIDYKSRRR